MTLIKIIAYDVIKNMPVCATVNESNVWCDPVGCPLADQTRYSRVFPQIEPDYKGARLFTVCTIAFMASFIGLILFAAWFTAHFIAPTP